jgi:uncharacterized protein
MNILVTGSSGLIGSALVPSLTGRQHTVHTLLRRQPPAEQPFWDPSRNIIDLGQTPAFDAVIHLAGESIAQGRWSAQKKARVKESRVRGTGLLVKTLAELEHPPSLLICASGIGFYGHRGDEIVTEDSSPGQGFLTEVSQAWEGAAHAAQDRGTRVVFMRLGVVLSKAGGALRAMLMPFRLGLGGRIGPGTQFMSWISLEDVLEIVHLIINNSDIKGPVNVVSPHPVTNSQFTQALGHVLKRPTPFPLPAGLARLLIGEMADALLLASTRAQPKKLTDAGYVFRYPDLDSALQTILGP